MFARFALAFSDAFGSARAFATTTALVLAWLAIMPWIGVTQWNSSWGLAGNTTESTIELFLAIAVQYTSNRIEKRQEAQMQALLTATQHVSEQNQRIEALERALAAREDAVAAAVAEELALLRQALGSAAPSAP